MRTLVEVEREILAVAVDEVRLGALLGERAALIRAIQESLPGLAGAAREECYDLLLAHHAAGQALAARLQQNRARLVEAWGESTRERQLVRLYEATQVGRVPELVELG